MVDDEKFMDPRWDTFHFVAAVLTAESVVSNGMRKIGLLPANASK